MKTYINPVDFGADPTGVADSTSAVLAALDHAKSLQGDKILLFPKGEYHFWPEKAAVRVYRASNSLGSSKNDLIYGADHYIPFLVENIRNLTIDGGGSKIYFHKYIEPFAVIGSENITIKNFSMNHLSRNGVDITILEAPDSHTRAVYVPAHCRYEIEPGNKSIAIYGEDNYFRWTGIGADNNLGVYMQYFEGEYRQLDTALTLHDTKTGITQRSDEYKGNLPNALKNIDSIRQLPGSRLEITYNDTAHIPSVGQVCMYSCAARYSEAFFISESKQVTISDIKTGYTQSWGMVAQMSEDITVKNVDWANYQENGEIMVAAADIIQMVGIKGHVLVENCNFSVSRDDPVNIHGVYMGIVGYEKGRYTVRYQHNATLGFQQYYVGDEVEIYRRCDLQSFGTAKVTEIIDMPDYKNVPAFICDNERDKLKEMTIQLDVDIPVSISCDKDNPMFIMENITYTPEININNNVFKGSSTRGILASSRKKILVENNYFESIHMPCIRICPEAGSAWYESGVVQDLTIRGNVFNRLNERAIHIIPNPGNVYCNKNITIEDNKFYLAAQRVSHFPAPNYGVIEAQGVDGLIIRNNEFYCYEPNTILYHESSYVIAFSNNCKNITIAHNRYDLGMDTHVRNHHYAKKLNIISDSISCPK